MSDLLTGDIPESPAASKKKTGVTHLNNRPLIAIVMCGAAILSIAAFALKAMGDRQNKTAVQAEDDYSAVKQSNFVDSYLKDRSDGVIAHDIPPPPPAFLTEEKPDSALKTVSLQTATESAPVEKETERSPVLPPCGTEADCQKEAKLREALATEQMRMEMLKRAQLETAANDAMRVNFNRSGDPEIGVCRDEDCETGKGKTQTTTQQDRTPEQIRADASSNGNMMFELLKTRMEAAGAGNVVPAGGRGDAPNSSLSATGFGGNGIGGGNSDLNTNLGNYIAGKSNISSGHQNNLQEGVYLEQSLEDPRSQIEIKAGTVIRATMLTGINSDLPGQVIGQVSRNVWDTIDGEYILIPQGTRLIGRYESGISFGQKRVLVAWDRLIYPNGQSIRLEGMGGYDKAGQSGYKDKINNHYIKAFSSAVLFSIVSAGVSKVDSQTDTDTGLFSTESEFKKELGKQISQLSNKYIDRALNISPTLSIRQGYVMNIMVDKDIVLPPYLNMHEQFRSRYGAEKQ